MRDYFCGWYFKCQSQAQTLAVIPAIHRSKARNSCSIQLITDGCAWNVNLPYEEFNADTKLFHIRVKNSYFGKEGIRLSINAPDLTANGYVSFGEFSPIKYDIMGPFRYMPFMECRHSVISMSHTINGSIRINGSDYVFQNGVGYIEGDRGYSFPDKYAWTQCCFDGGSLMLSIANIPYGALRFTGIIGIIHWQGKEHRLATYLGAKAEKIEKNEIIVKQGNKILEVKLINKQSLPLFAPINGCMNRIIHESVSCHVAYRLREKDKTLFEFESRNASFEYEYG